MDQVEKTVERVLQMLSDLSLAGIPMTHVSKAAGVNGVTLWQIKKGGQKSVSERVYDSIWDFWSEHAPPKDTDTGPTNGQVKVSENPLESTGAIQVTTAVKTKVAKRTPRKQAPEAANAAKLLPFDATRMINRDLVPVDVDRLVAHLDGMIERFRVQVDELNAVKQLLR